MQLDPRSVANLIIEEANSRNLAVTHLSLQKILYFLQGRYLIETGQPLMSGYFEAWQYGPVHPLIYDAFKSKGAQPLTEPACKRDLLTGRSKAVDKPFDEAVSRFVRDIALPYLRLSPGRLVDLSHARESPWDFVTRTAAGGRSYGLRMTDEVIKERFRFHKVSISAQPRIGEPNEESPPY
jgi:uncharacterized phage-associated protein